MLKKNLTVALGVAVSILAGCAAPPDTTLHPSAPMVRYAPLQHPFREARLAVDPSSAAAQWQATHNARWLDPITQTAQARWVNGPADIPAAARFAETTARRHELAVFVAYDIPRRGCAPGTGGAPDAGAYLRWIDQLTHALRSTRAVVVLEPDAVAADCFDAQRGALLTEATRRLVAAGQYVYIDAGHAGWRSTGEMADRLLKSGINLAEGFAVNVSNRATTSESYRYGRELADLVGNREFVIDTSRNGFGAPADGQWCNVPHQALGQPPTTSPGLPGVAALLWVKPPGESDGKCGGETTFGFSPRQARTLIANAAWVR